VFFTVMFPVMFLVIFDLVFGGDDRSTASAWTAAPITCRRSSPSPCFGDLHLAMSVTIDREFGILKRGRGTPFPTGCSSPAGSAARWSSPVMLVLLGAIGSACGSRFLGQASA
jgi:hypothetical protein